MRILILGKCPPVQGGVSATTLATSTILAEAGHEVHLVTNAKSVEWPYRMLMDTDDWKELSNHAYPNGGSRSIHFSSEAEKLSFIPWADPFVSALSGDALNLLSNAPFDLIYAHYFEPYGVAAAFVSAMSKIPFAVRHAGSDLARLAQVDSLRTTYRAMIGKASAVITSGQRSTVDLLARLGVTNDKVLIDSCFSLLTARFRPAIHPMDINLLLERSHEWLASLRFPDSIQAYVKTLNSRPVDSSSPVIGIYGKAGLTKGTYDLLSAMGIVLKEQSAYLVMVTNGTERSWTSIRKLIDALDLANHVRILPFLPPWKIASFIRSCRAVCFLERDFPIDIHSPVVPREVLACGTPLICSSEIVSKFPFNDSVVHMRNMIVVDPRNSGQLAAGLRFVLNDSKEANAIGLEGNNLSHALENETLYRRTREDLFKAAIRMANLNSS